MRRRPRKDTQSDEGVVKGSGIAIDFSGHILEVDGQEVSLAPTEWNLLAQLSSKEGTVVTHKELAESVWGVDQMDPAAIKMAVRRLRLKLGDDSVPPNIIRSHRGVGYSFDLGREHPSPPPE